MELMWVRRMKDEAACWLVVALSWVQCQQLICRWPRQFCRLLVRVLGYGLAFMSAPVASPRLFRGACWRVLGYWLSGRLRWQALGYLVVLVGESSAILVGMSGDLGKSV